MNWQTTIGFDGPGFNVNLYIHRDAGHNEVEVMYPTGKDGEWTTERGGPQMRLRPTLSFNLHEGQGILRSLAEQLATHGFSTLDPGGVAKAKDAHIAELQRMTDRLFTLAERKPVVILGRNIEDSRP
jgi:hypothetical protein